MLAISKTIARLRAGHIRPGRIRELERLDDHILRDIGLSRRDLGFVSLPRADSWHVN